MPRKIWVRDFERRLGRSNEVQPPKHRHDQRGDAWACRFLFFGEHPCADGDGALVETGRGGSMTKIVKSGSPGESANCSLRAAEAAARGLVGRTVADVERDLILDTLDHCLGNRTHAARILGISLRTLRNKLNEYLGAGISIPDPRRVRPAA